jgi:hypothetical protein
MPGGEIAVEITNTSIMALTRDRSGALDPSPGKAAHNRKSSVDKNSELKRVCWAQVRSMRKHGLSALLGSPRRFGYGHTPEYLSGS